MAIRRALASVRVGSDHSFRRSLRSRRLILERALGLALATVVMTTTAANAHHAFAAEFDADKPIKLEGVVTRMDWVNPHSWIHIDVKKPDGTIEQWMIEGGTPNALFRRGLTKNSLAAGTVIIVTGYQAKDGTLRGNGRDLTFADGRKLFLGSSGTGAPRDGRDPADSSR